MNGYLQTALLVCLLVLGQSCAAGIRNGKDVTLTGTIRVVGNEPFTHVVLTVSGGENAPALDYVMTGPLTEELRRHHQGEVISLDGSICTPPPRFTRCFRPSQITIIDPEKQR
jgi:hypothetical protein